MAELGVVSGPYFFLRPRRRKPKPINPVPIKSQEAGMGIGVCWFFPKPAKPVVTESVGLMWRAAQNLG